MATQKININTASKDNLLKIPGIGNAGADKIINFRKSGGVINSFDEVIEVTALRDVYKEDMKETVILQDIVLDTPLQPSIPSIPGLIDIDTAAPLIPLNPTLPLQPIPLPIFESYKFKVILEGIDDEVLPSLFGYKLVVGYRIGNYVGGNQTNYVKKSKTFNIGSISTVDVSLVKPFVSASFLEDNFNLLILDDEGKVIYDSTFQIDEAGEVKIGLPVFLKQNLKVSLDKVQNVNYEGYKFKITSKTNRGVSGIQSQTQTFDINSQSILEVGFDSFGEVQELIFEAFAASGVKILNETQSWKTINEVSGVKALTIKLPNPNELAYKIQLVVDPEELNNPYLDHRLVLSYNIYDTDTRDFVKRIEKIFIINALGQAEVDLDYYGIIDEMELQVKAPSGEVIGKRTIGLQDIDANNEVEVKVPPKQLAGVDGIETLPERPKKTSGRVIDAKGDKKFEEVQVIIYAATKESPEDEDFRPIKIASTETEGYFLIETPLGYYTEAFATVGIPKKGNNDAESINVPIRLERDKVVLVDDGEVEIVEKLFFPANIILVVDTPEDNDEDCGCNDCGSLDFHSHKRVVDEFSFYTVVRTTEPDIKGYTLEEDGEMSIQDVINIIPSLEDESSNNSNITSDFRHQKIRKNILLKHLNDKKGVTFTTLTKALNESNAKKLRGEILPQKQISAVGRHILDINNSIDWDEEPTIYQAITLSHGHLLHFKQEWVNDGYGMGDLLYSLPLAPGQKKQIVVYDWERRESASRTEALDYQESLHNSLSRDRDINEIVNGSLQENVRGGSSATTSAFGAGFGIGAIGSGIGALLGVAGGSSKASSSAWQNSSRTTALNDLQQLRDKTVQSANSVRSQRGTVIQTATQGERFSVETEVVANYNHCHSMTMQYFEVLRHLKIQQRLSSVQECLFIPLIMTPFDSQKILRWREALNRYVYSSRLRRGFDAIERIDNDYEGSDLPEGTFAEENLNFIEGGLNIKFDIPSPSDLTLLETRDKVKEALAPILPLLGNIDAHIDRVFAAEASKRNEIFYNYIAPELAAAFIENLRFEAVIQTSNDGNETTLELPVDTSLITRFQNGRSHYVSLRQNDQLDGISRESIKAINVTKAANITLSGGQSIADTLPGNTKITITSGSMRYRTEHFSGTLFRKSRILDDLVGYGYNDDSERVRIATPLNRSEMRNPRNEDLELANALQDHLNDNLEQYHKVIWMTMSDERRFMFLDGIQVTDYSDTTNYPGGIIRSVASVVENRVIGIVGNNLVMPVAPGFRLDPNTRGNDIDLISLYQPLTPLEPINVSIPTKGVFAEAVMGKCNSCEIKEEDRFWKWEEHPIPDSPTAISTINTDSRRSEPLDTTPTSFPNPIVNIQNAPDAPDPTGIAALQELLGKQSFENITGLDQNQKNALAALQSSLSTAQAFGTKAGDMAALGAQLEAIKDAKENKMLDQDKAKELTEEALKSYNSGTSSSEVLQGLDQLKKVQEMVTNGNIPEDLGNKLSQGIIDTLSKGDTSVLENPAIQERISEGDSLEFSSNDESISLGSEKSGDQTQDNTLLKFTVNFRKPRVFARANNSGHVNVGYAGHFGFDWLRDEYINPIINVTTDLSGNAINAKTPLCTDVAALKAEYLKGVTHPITPYGNEYYPSWVSIFPPRGIPNFDKGSRMHEAGVNFTLEIDEIDVLDNRENTIEFRSTNGLLSITPTSIKMEDIIKKGKKKTKVLDVGAGISRTYWEIEDIVTLKSDKGLLNSHAEIRVFAKGTDKEEEVGKLMVYKNNRIPKAELVMVRVSYNDVNVNLSSSYHDILKNQSFNQALIRAEVVADEKFIINDLDPADPDVINFKTSYPDGTQHNSNNFLNDLITLYQKLGNHNPPAGSKRSIIFITDQTATAGGIAQGSGYVAGKFQWGNAVAVFGNNLANQDTFVHEIAHSLSLAHTFDNDPLDAGILHRYYRGYTDNYMDYTTTSGSASVNPNTRLYFYKWQWDIMRTDQSLIDNY